MAPTCTRDSDTSMLSTKDKHKLRKPAVEKMRRDRINICIEQLKTLLEKEFHKQDPNAKLEKADILEMTVVFLKQQLQSRSMVPLRAHGQGYSQCWREALHFLSASSTKDATLQHLQHLQHLHGAQRVSLDVCAASPLSSQLHSQGPVKQATSTHKPVWRPW
ncbi:hairy and enhancer of split-related 15, tandem duplicate 1 [Hypomesus transpacificus]|uniref:hairy and enhancer of split-related 15, tandem duplicate 1 n=1 Tax=Hypomesus transpacificus TaxID=137520 RepID=UPI001F07F66F|nr:hairy and enhancer of split-related 15, tandem duplicate 1 [Hypomesus transpacificus]